MHNDWLQPAEALGAVGTVGAVMTTRAGGVSISPFDTMNLGSRVGDEEAAVVRNRESLALVMGARPVFLQQVHGSTVVRLRTSDAAASPATDMFQADAAFTMDFGVACVVQVADCMPVLFAHEDGRVVGAAHAGWRGLAAGVLERMVHAMCGAAACEPNALRAWLGPCIGPQAFEVGKDVFDAFATWPMHFREARRPDGSMRWRADLPALAQERLNGVGLGRVVLSGACTVADRTRFYSYRRDGTTGRHAAAIWRRA